MLGILDTILNPCNEPTCMRRAGRIAGSKRSRLLIADQFEWAPSRLNAGLGTPTLTKARADLATRGRSAKLDGTEFLCESFKASLIPHG